MSYPGTIDSFGTVAGTTVKSTDGHAARHNGISRAVEAIEGVLGTTAGTSVLMNFSAGDFAARVNDETFGTPTIEGGTINNAIFGTPSITGGTIDSSLIGTSTIQGGTVNDAVMGSPAITGGTQNGLLVEGTLQGVGGTLALGSASLQFPQADGTSNQVIVTDGAGVLSWATQSASGGASFWTDMPEVTRTDDDTITIVDTGGSEGYTNLFQKGIVVKWLEGGTYATGMIISSSYASDTVTIELIGDTYSAAGSNMQYGIQHAQAETFIIPGYQAVATDIAKSWYLPYPIYPLAADVYVKTAGATGTSIWDINHNGTTMFTTKPQIGTTGTADINNEADAPTTAIPGAEVITVDIDQVTTTAPQEAYLYFWYYPVSWRYRS